MKPSALIVRLASERRAKGLTIYDVAEKSGYSMSMLEKMECGHRTPSVPALTAWAETLGYEIVLRPKEPK